MDLAKAEVGGCSFSAVERDFVEGRHPHKAGGKVCF